MYSSFRRFAERLLRIPHDPAPPPGDEGSTRLFRAAANYYKYLLCLWGIKALASILPVLVFLIFGVVASVTVLKEKGGWSVLVLVIVVVILLMHIVSSIVGL